MPAATNFPELLNFEGNFEESTHAVLTASGVASFLTQQKTQLPLLQVSIGVTVDPAIDELTDIPKPPGWPADLPPPQEYFRYPATLELRLECARDKNGASIPGVDTMLEQVRGLARNAFMRTVYPFNDSNTPFYRVSDIRPFGGGGIVTDVVRNIDAVILRFRITFEIKPDAWPIS